MLFYQHWMSWVICISFLFSGRVGIRVELFFLRIFGDIHHQRGIYKYRAFLPSWRIKLIMSMKWFSIINNITFFIKNLFCLLLIYIEAFIWCLHGIYFSTFFLSVVLWYILNVFLTNSISLLLFLNPEWQSLSSSKIFNSLTANIITDIFGFKSTSYFVLFFWH